MNPLVSIIVPIYNSELYLEKCLNSIINQSYHHLDIILVNDGSSDNSLKICEEYKKVDNRITIINKENRGVSSARNEGLVNSRGDYIQFVDSDDWIDKKMVNTMVTYFLNEKVDGVICGLNIFKNGKKIRSPHLKRSKILIKEDFEKFVELFKILSSPCNKIFSRNLISKCFDTNLTSGEDLMFNIDYLENINSILTIEECLYNVQLDNENSINREFKEEKFENILTTRSEVAKFLSRIYGKNCDKTFIYNQIILGFHGYLKDSIKNDINTKKIINKYLRKEIVLNSIKNSEITDIRFKLFKLALKSKSSELIYLFVKFEYFLQSIIK